ncbi:MAG: glycosyltransferase, partial [Myxococcales bacterium]|nr:glycosyltransferase [Myxococcales bacterium]
DRTKDVIENLREHDERVRLAALTVNRGKGAALQEGVRVADGDHVIFFDADLSYPLEAVDRAMELLEENDVVVGGRDLDPSASDSYSPLRRLTSSSFNFVVDRLLGLGIPDTQCGFKAFRKEPAKALFSHLTVNRFGFDVELLYLSRRWNLSLTRIPVHMTHRPGSSVRVFRDSLQMLADIYRIRRNAREGIYPENLPA